MPQAIQIETQTEQQGLTLLRPQLTPDGYFVQGTEYNCTGWTNNSELGGIIGFTGGNIDNYNWSGNNNYYLCSNTEYLYCFQQ
jgi:hypothetical protein